MSRRRIHHNAPELVPDTGRFVIDRQLGVGGMGIVYRAFDSERDEYVAIKTLLRLKPSSLYRFKREFRALAGVHHPNLVSLYELFAAEDSWFFTMELLEGQDLSAYVHHSAAPIVALAPSGPDSTRVIDDDDERRRATVDYDRLARALPQLVAGVQALHASGHLHRDIKPSNVFVTANERVVLLDFGVITELSGPRSTRDELVGTPLYMAPEIGAPGQVAGPASDWYAIGMTLYVLLTGRRPFDGTPAQIMQVKREVEPPSPRTYRADIPPELDELIRALLERDPRRRAGSAEILSYLGDQRPQPRDRPAARIARATLTGRERELTALRAAYEETRGGAGITVYVRGGSGMGKTALVEHFLSDIGGDTIVLTGRCYERESVPYQGVDSVVDAMSQFLAGLPAHEAAALLPRDIRPLERVFPVLRRVEAVAQARRRDLAPSDPQQLRRRAFTALRELVARMAAQQPVIVHIDDIQWGDLDSAPLLADLMRPPNEPPLLLVLSYRTEDAERSPLIRLLQRRDDRLGPASRSRVVDVGPLRFDDARRVAGALLAIAGADTGAAEVIARESHGSPYFLEALVGFAAISGVADHVPTLETVLGARVAALADDVRRLLEVVCVAGQPIRLDIVRSAARLHHSETDALHVLRSQKLVRLSGIRASDTVEAYHDRIRETVVAGLTATTRRELHARLADALRRADADAERLAWHYLEAGDHAGAGTSAIETANLAAAALAFERAARHYELALSVLTDLEPRERGELLVALANALANAGRAASAADAYLEAVATGTRADAIDLQRAAGEHLLRSGHVDRGMALLRVVLDSCRLGFPSGSIRTLLALLARRAQLRLRGLGFRVRDEPDVPPAQLRRVDICGSVALSVSMVDTILGANYQTLHLLLALRSGEIVRVVRALSTEVAYSATMGTRNRRRTARLLAMVERLADDAERARQAAPAQDGAIYRCQEQAAYIRGYADLTGGVAAYLEGRFADSRRLCLRADDIFRNSCKGVDWEVDTAALFALFAALYLGDLEAVRHSVDRRLRECESKGDLYGSTNLRARITYLPMLAANEPAAARREVAAAVEGWSHTSFHLQHFYRAFAECEIDLYESEGNACLERASRTIVDLKRSQLLRVQWIRIEATHLRARGALAAARAERDPARRLTLVRTAVKFARAIEREKTHYGSAYTAVIRGAAAAVSGDIDAALAHTDRAAAEFSAADMMLYAAACAVSRGVLGNEPDTETIDWLRDRGIRRPERFSAMLTPGFTDLPSDIGRYRSTSS